MMKLAVTLALVLFACFLMIHAQDQDCPCIMTLEYDPHCGSDGVTYASEGALRCRNECNPRTPTVKSDRRGRCEDPIEV